MTGLANPSEPHVIRRALKWIDADLPTDYMFYAQGLKVPIERKEVPGDFMASWYDGRLTEQVGHMAEGGLGILLLEGSFPVRRDLHIQLGPQVSQISIVEITNRLVSYHMRGIITVQSPSMQMTPYILRGLYDLFSKPEHLSLLERPTLKVPSSWRMPTKKIRGLHFIQGIFRVGPKRAMKLWEKAGKLRLISVLTREELQETIGPKLGAAADDFLEMAWEPEEGEDEPVGDGG